MKQTPLYHLHLELGAKMVPFAGYAMPVQYRDGILKEHLHTRQQAGLFDVSHMGQLEISGKQAQQELEKCLPLDLDTLAVGQMVYSFLPNAQGAVMDDLMVTRHGQHHFMLVVNAGCKDKVLAYFSAQLQSSHIHLLEDHALLALQGPTSLDVLLKLFPADIARLRFMQSLSLPFDGVDCCVSRSGYTGEDGFEISVAATYAEKLARKLLAIETVKPIGLGARDSLRLEAGLCLYGHELNEEISPIEASIGWSISKSRRSGGAKAGGFVGSDIILHQLAADSVNSFLIRKRVGLIVQGKVPVREGAILFDEKNQEVGMVSSGTFSPSLNVPVAMAMVDSRAAITGQFLKTAVRGKEVTLIITRLPFVAHHYVREFLE